MRKIICAMLAAATVLSMFGCGRRTTEPSPTPVNPPIVQPNTTDRSMDGKTYAEDNYLADGDYEIRFLRAALVNDTPRRIRVDYVFTNYSEKSVSTDGALLFKAYQDGLELMELPTSFHASSVTSLRPSMSMSDYVEFAVDYDGGDIRIEASCTLGDGSYVVAETFEISSLEKTTGTALQRYEDVREQDYTEPLAEADPNGTLLQGADISISDMYVIERDDEMWEMRREEHYTVSFSIVIDHADAMFDPLYDLIAPMVYQNGASVMITDMSYASSTNTDGTIRGELTYSVQTESLSPLEVEIYSLDDLSVPAATNVLDIMYQ